MTAPELGETNESGLFEAPLGFSEKVNYAFKAFINNPIYEGQLGKFRATYEYRRNFVFLGESGKLPGIEDGLSYAMFSALTIYRFDFGTTFEEEREEIQGELCHKIDDEFKDKLLRTLEELGKRDSFLGRDAYDGLAYALYCDDVDITNISTEQLIPHIGASLAAYSDSITTGTSGESW